jgi:hypothetical protein
MRVREWMASTGERSLLNHFFKDLN